MNEPTVTTRTEYVVYIPDDRSPEGRRQVGRYADVLEGEDPGDQRAREHVTRLHQLAIEQPWNAEFRRAEAYAVQQVIVVTERRLT